MQRRDSVDAYTVRAGRSGPAFFVHVITKFDNRTNAPFSHGIDVGGNMRGCVRITVNVPDATLLRDERFGGFEESKKDAFISFVGYNRKCSLRDDLPSGDGTRHMIRVAMAFVLTNFTWVETFSLVDASHVLCTETGQVIDLSHLSLMTTGKTYYERYLGARLKRPEARVAYARDVAALSAADAKLDFDTFCRAYNVPHPVAVYMQAAYAASRTYLEFFRALRAACERKPPPSFPSFPSFCAVVRDWGDAFIHHTLSNNLYAMETWTIPAPAELARVEIEQLSSEQSANADRVIQEEFKQFAGGGASFRGPRHLQLLGPDDAV